MPTQAMRRIHIIYPDFHSLYFHARLSPADINFVLQSSGFTRSTPYGLIDCLFGTLVGVHALMYRVTLGLCPVIHRTSEFFFISVIKFLQDVKLYTAKTIHDVLALWV